MTLPFANHTAVPPAAWHPEPTYRGTFSVLSSCILTLLLCVWTAIHLNVPEHGKEHHQWWRKVGWLLAALLAPEVVAWNAALQRSHVKSLTARMNALGMRRKAAKLQNDGDVISPRKSLLQRASGVLSRVCNPAKRAWHAVMVSFMLRPDERAKDRHDAALSGAEQDVASTWTDVHSWYAITGGFAFDASHARDAFLPDGRKRITLTPEGVYYLAQYRPELLPQLSAEDLADKSKSDGFAKLVTCWQANWFCCQCIFRLSQGLAISLLELIVFAHAVCALAIYVLWWSKPKDVQQPFILAGRDVDAVAALFCLLSPFGLPNEEGVFGKSPPMTLTAPRKRTPQGYLWVITKPVRVFRHLPDVPGLSTYPLRDIAYPNALKLGDVVWCLITRVKQVDEATDAGGLPTSFHPTSYELEVSVTIDAYCARRLRLAGSTSHMLSEMICQSALQCEPDSSRLHPLVLEPTHNFYGLYPLEFGTMKMVLQVAVLCMATTLYGALHALAWNAGFATSREQLLWRLSSLALTTISPVILLYCTIAAAVFFVSMSALVPGVPTTMIKDFNTRVDIQESKGYIWALAITGVAVGPFAVPAAATGPLWLFGRAYLVVESFISLTHPSDEMLRLPVWAQYIPHLG